MHARIWTAPTWRTVIHIRCFFSRVCSFVSLTISSILAAICNRCTCDKTFYTGEDCNLGAIFRPTIKPQEKSVNNHWSENGWRSWLASLTWTRGNQLESDGRSWVIFDAIGLANPISPPVSSFLGLCCRFSPTFPLLLQLSWRSTVCYQYQGSSRHSRTKRSGDFTFSLIAGTSEPRSARKLICGSRCWARVIQKKMSRPLVLKSSFKLQNLTFLPTP